VNRLSVDRCDGLVSGWMTGLVTSVNRDCGNRQEDLL
jgi:hypothetical protein